MAIQAKGDDVENGKDVVDVVIDNVVEKLSDRQVVVFDSIGCYCHSGSFSHPRGKPIAVTSMDG